MEVRLHFWSVRICDPKVYDDAWNGECISPSAPHHRFGSIQDLYTYDHLSRTHYCFGWGVFFGGGEGNCAGRVWQLCLWGETSTVGVQLSSTSTLLHLRLQGVNWVMCFRPKLGITPKPEFRPLLGAKTFSMEDSSAVTFLDFLKVSSTVQSNSDNCGTSRSGFSNFPSS